MSGATHGSLSGATTSLGKLAPDAPGGKEPDALPTERRQELQRVLSGEGPQGPLSLDRA